MHDEMPAASAASRRTCRVHLVRHGQTIMNAQVRFRGRLEVPLNEVGRAEAREAARSLVGSGLVAVYTSPLGRAREVAEAIAVKNGVGAVRAQPGLLNLDYGAWEGLTKEESAQVDPDAWDALRERSRAGCLPRGRGGRRGGGSRRRSAARDRAGASRAERRGGVARRHAAPGGAARGRRLGRRLAVRDADRRRDRVRRSTATRSRWSPTSTAASRIRARRLAPRLRCLNARVDLRGRARSGQARRSPGALVGA